MNEYSLAKVQFHIISRFVCKVKISIYTIQGKTNRKACENKKFSLVS